MIVAYHGKAKMPNRIVQDLIDAVKVLQTDVKWIKRLLIGAGSLTITIIGALIPVIMGHISWK